MIIGDIKDTLAARIQAAITAVPCRAYGWVTDKPEIPSSGVAVIVSGPQFPDLEFNTVFAKGMATLKLTLMCLVQDTTDGRGERLLDQLMSAGAGASVSLLDAFESVEFTSSPPWNDALISSCGHQGRVETPDANTSYLRADFTVEVRKSRV
jgi:hypothetical protein